MIVTYTPGGGAERVIEFKPSDVDVETAELIETHADQGFTQWVQAAMQGRARALRVMLWFMLRQDLPALKFADTPKFRMGEVKIDLDHEELLEAKANIATVQDSTARAKAEALIDASLAKYEGKTLGKES
ncbi:hypothetical protein [Saccharopolyspora hattusasensis]|uniref:hypothetical protein n=1 Tax=Saccharopolyspora hattusasensis TaxID=1128679 RepID=UPI003D980E05